jgi:hypothetical protein
MIVPGNSGFNWFLGRRMQVAFVVSDIIKAMAYWTDVLKIGPFVLFEDSVTGRRFEYRGQVTAVDVAIAFSHVGQTQIELIQQRNAAQSPYREFLESGREGIHHIAFWPDSYLAACTAMTRAGCTEVYSIYSNEGTKEVSYFDVPSHMGVMIEIVPLTPLRQKYFGAIKALSDNWDGMRAVRTFKNRAEFIESDEYNRALESDASQLDGNRAFQ